MKTQVRYRQVQNRTGVERELGRQIAKLDRRLKKFAPDLVDLHVSVEHEGKPATPFNASVTLSLPPGRLHADEDAPDPVGALKEAFGEVNRELNKLKTRLNRKNRRRGLAPRKRVLT